MNHQLFEEFNTIPPKQWKNKIQYELDGVDYNKTLVWESLEGIKVRPFYHKDESHPFPIATQTTQWQLVHHIYIHDLEKSISNATTSLQKGTEAIYFTLANPAIDLTLLLVALPKNAVYFFRFTFLDPTYIKQVSQWATQNKYTIHLLIDPIYQLVTDGNWFHNVTQDFTITDTLLGQSSQVNLVIDTKAYQNAGATIIQQVAYACSHWNEYLLRLKIQQQPIFIEVATGGTYFFEIAKLKALRMLFELLAQEYGQHTLNIKIISTPTKRNKTLYSSTINQLRTTTECMSAILGGTDFISNLPYDALYRKDNYLSQQIARNQLSLLKKEACFTAVDNPTEGTYYIDYLTKQIAEKALDIFKQIEKSDGFITSLHAGTIQRKIHESAEKEQDLFNTQKEILLGINRDLNTQERMQTQLELYPFVKQKPRKTLIAPLIEKRLAEAHEQHRLAQENK